MKKTTVKLSKIVCHFQSKSGGFSRMVVFDPKKQKPERFAVIQEAELVPCGVTKMKDAIVRKKTGRMGLVLAVTWREKTGRQSRKGIRPLSPDERRTIAKKTALRADGIIKASTPEGRCK